MFTWSCTLEVCEESEFLKLLSKSKSGSSSNMVKYALRCVGVPPKATFPFALKAAVVL